VSSGKGPGIDDISEKMSDLAGDLKIITGSLRKIVENNKNDIESLIKSLNRTASNMEKLLGSIDSEQVGKDLKRLGEAASHLNSSLDHIENISSKIDRGEGTIGKLINDPRTAEELNRTLMTVNRALDRASRVQSIVDMHSDYVTERNASVTRVGIWLKTRDTSGYLAQVVIDPAGTRKTVVTTTQKDSEPVSRTETVTNDRSAMKYSLQFYRRIGDVACRLGLFESSGGVAIDSYFWGDRLQATTELFQIGRKEDRAELRAFGRMYWWDSLYFEVGGENLITRVNKNDYQRSLSAGLGLRFTDEDIKTLFTFAGVP
jgi:phospholipid/cholesterol/gamma-HCH transport system substrate-binding protein